jgi:hypothetical protein
MSETIFELGLTEDSLSVRPNRHLNAVELWVIEADITLVLSPTTTVDVILRLISALHRLEGVT